MGKTNGLNSKGLPLTQSTSTPMGWFFAALLFAFSVSTALAQLAITQQPVSMNVGRGGSGVFALACNGTVIGYELLKEGVPVRTVATNASSIRIAVTNVQPSDAGTYSIRVWNPVSEATSTNVTLVVGNLVVWGLRSENQTRLMPLDLTTLEGASLSHAVGSTEFLAFGPDRKIRAWAEKPSSPVTNLPPDLPAPRDVLAGLTFGLLLTTNGTVSGWPSTSALVSKIPSGLTNVVKLAASSGIVLALLDESRVECWKPAGTDPVGSNVLNAIDVAAGKTYSLALIADGRVLYWSPVSPLAALPGFTNMLAVSSSENHYIALKRDGTVLGGGMNSFGETNVPAGLTNIVAVSAGEYFSMALDDKGKVYLWGKSASTFMTPPPTLTNVVSILSGENTAAVLVNDGEPGITIHPRSRNVQEDQPFTLSVRAVSPNDLQYQWYQNGTAIQNATNKDYAVSLTRVEDAGGYFAIVSDGFSSATSSVANIQVLEPLNLRIWGSPSSATDIPFGLTNVVSVSSWSDSVLALRHNGFVAQWGTNSTGLKTNTLAVRDGAIAVAAGLEHCLALQSNGKIISWASAGGGAAATVPSAATNIVAIAAGEKHSVALNSSGKVLVWGFQPSGVNILPPTNLPPTVAIAAGAAFSMALTKEGKVACWGQNSGTTLAPPPDLQDVDAIAAGRTHALALTRQGRVVAWGDSTGGKTDVPASATNIIAIAAGISHSLALRDDGEIIAWGAAGPALIPPPGLSNVIGMAVTASNSIAVIGTGEPTILDQPFDNSLVAGNSFFLTARVAGQQPISYQWYHNGTAIDGATNRIFTMAGVQVDGGGNYTFTATNSLGSITSRDVQVTVNPSRSVAAWGNNGYGQAIVPPDVQGAIKVAAGTYHSLAIRSNGTVAAWGRNDYSQCFISQTLSNVIDIAAGDQFSLTLTSDGKVQAWGQTNIVMPFSSPPGTIAVKDRMYSVTSPGPVRSIAAGMTHAMALYTFDYVYQWGTVLNEEAPSASVPPGVIAIAAGAQHCVTLHSNGTVFCWAYDRNTRNKPLVTQPPDLTNAVAIAAAAHHTLALRSDGTVVGWGFIPELFTPPSDLTNAVAIATKARFSAALTADGRVVTWGWPHLDPEDYADRSAPQGLSNILSIAVGDGHVLAISGDPKPFISLQPKSQSVVQGWPLKLSTTATGQGQLSYQWQINAENIPGATNTTLTLSNTTAADFGDYRVIVTNLLGTSTSSVARVVRGEVLGWGMYNTSDQLTVPTTATNVAALAAGTDHVLALRNDGTLSAWGYVKAPQIPRIMSIAGATAVAAGNESGTVIHANGTTTSWSWTGADNLPDFNSPITSIGYDHDGVGVASLGDGSVVAWGAVSPAMSNFVSTLSNVAKVDVGQHSECIATHRDGTFSTFANWWRLSLWDRLYDVVDFSRFTTLVFGQVDGFALLPDKTVVGVSTGTPVPGFTNIVAIAEGFKSIMGLRSDGTVAFQGTNFPPPGPMSNVVEIASGNGCYFARFGDGSPRIAVEPLDRNTIGATKTYLTVFAVGQAPMNYQWQRNGQTIEGATNYFYVVNDTLGTNGLYRCIITNSLGSVTSRVAEVSFYFPPPYLTVGDPATWETNGFTFSVWSLKGQQPAIVYSSSNLVDWVPIYTNPPISPTGPPFFQVSDPAWTNYNHRFFRVSEER